MPESSTPYMDQVCTLLQHTCASHDSWLQFLDGSTGSLITCWLGIIAGAWNGRDACPLPGGNFAKLGCCAGHTLPYDTVAEGYSKDKYQSGLQTQLNMLDKHFANPDLDDSSAPILPGLDAYLKDADNDVRRHTAHVPDVVRGKPEDLMYDTGGGPPPLANPLFDTEHQSS
jgi:hypothetical protein